MENNIRNDDVAREGSEKVCRRCGKILDSTEASDGLCRQCKIEIEEEKITQSKGEEEETTTPETKSKFLSVFKWALLIASSALILANSVILVKLLFFNTPSEESTIPDLPKDAILCLSNLSDIAELLQQGELPSDSIVCPVSGLPYRIEIKDQDTFVYCPAPEKHQLKALWVSKKNPVPEVLK